MAKTSAERKAAQRRRLKESAKYEEFRKSETNRQNIARNKRKQEMTKEEEEIKRSKKRLEMERYREKCSLKQISNSFVTSTKAFKSKSSYGKAMAKAKRSLPKSPTKRKLVVEKLWQQNSPRVISQKPQKSVTNAISTEVYNLVKEFYASDALSYQAPGFKDFKIIRDSGGKSKIQKRYLYFTLGETYQQFKEKYPNVSIGRSKFCDFRPKHISLRHETPLNLCLCVYHENIKLLLNACHFLPNNISEFIQLIVCCRNSKNCMLQKCESCKNLIKFKEFISEKCSQDDTTHDVAFKQWVKDEADKLTRETLTGTVKEMLEKLEKKLPMFLEHEFVRESQAQFLKNLKLNITEDAALIHMDFSENYQFSYQDEIQSAYWAANSCTIFTTMAYINYQKEQISIPIVVVSDYMQQDKYAVAVFANAVKKIKDKCPNRRNVRNLLVLLFLLRTIYFYVCFVCV